MYTHIYIYIEREREQRPRAAEPAASRDSGFMCKVGGGCCSLSLSLSLSLSIYIYICIYVCNSYRYIDI